MALDIGRKKYVTVVDRTIPEVYSSGRKLSRLDIIELSWALKSLGVDILEITSEVFGKIGKLPKGIDYMLRISSEEDLQLTFSNDIKHVVIKEGLLFSMENLPEADLPEFTVEYGVEGVRDLYDLLDRKDLGFGKLSGTVRLMGLNRCSTPAWANMIEKLRSKFKANIDICPQNNTNMATSIAVEALIQGSDSINTSFMGIGKPHGYAPFEEVVTAAKVMINPGMKVDLGLLPGFCRQFTKITGIKVPESKPIIGRNIFQYESGVHADGIDKNPSTYEPFEPKLVGQKRQLAIGKHSGRKSIEKKLKELGISFDNSNMDSIVALIREQSIKLGRSLEDEEIAGFFYRNEVAGM